MKRNFILIVTVSILCLISGVLAHKAEDNKDQSKLDDAKLTEDQIKTRQNIEMMRQ